MTAFSEFMQRLLHAGGTTRTIISDPELGLLRDKVLEVFIDVVGVENVEGLVSAMTRSRAVISGSKALSLLVESVEARDIDWYVPKSRSTYLLRFFEGLGFTVMKITRTSKYCGGFESVHKLTKKGRADMDVITSRTESPLYPLAYFHSAVVMNFVTPTSLFTAYPTVISRGQNLFNLNACTDVNGLKSTDHLINAYRNDERFGKMNKCVKEALMKYERRGFRLCDVTGEHKCTQSEVCLHTARTTTDPYGLLLVFDLEKSKLVEKERTEEENALRTLDGGMILWRLGGPACCWGGLPTSAFVNQSAIDL